MSGTEGKIYFASDVHLGLEVNDNADRERRFVKFLKSINAPDTKALYLLGDIWDFWYEYEDVIPKDGFRTLSALVELVDAGIDVYFMPGNHDIWCYSFFESLGIKKIQQPYNVELNGIRFCLGHGDCMGGAGLGYKIVQNIFHNRLAQVLFSCLHPYLAFRFGKNWSLSNRAKHSGYVFEKSTSFLYRFASEYAKSNTVDIFLFGHLHRGIDLQMECGSRFIILKDWIDCDCPYAVLNGTCVELHS